MHAIRQTFDLFYKAIKPAVFAATKKDPEAAHHLFVSFLRFLYGDDLDRLVLDNRANKTPSSIELSNAAGFNKNGEIPPRALQYLGFERVVVGTVTYDAWKGNPRPRTVRYPGTGSLVNWMGLPGDGAQAIAERILCYGAQDVPLTINLMSTPQKKGDDVLRDLEGTVLAFRDVPSVDRFELNISCPNTHSQEGGLDARKEYQQQLDGMLGVLGSLVKCQEIYLKVSPDLDRQGVDDVFFAIERHPVAGFTTTNTTTHHDPEFISESPEKGGASGNAVYDRSCEVQRMFYDVIRDHSLDLKVIACGGINSVQRADERVMLGASEIQLYTPLIFSGPKILYELRDAFRKDSDDPLL